MHYQSQLSTNIFLCIEHSFQLKKRDNLAYQYESIALYFTMKIQNKKLNISVFVNMFRSIDNILKRSINSSKKSVSYQKFSG